LRLSASKKSSNKELSLIYDDISAMLNRISIAQRLQDRSEKPGEALRQAQCGSRSAGFVPDLKRIARTKVQKEL
jgi:hypothetical protein